MFNSHNKHFYQSNLELYPITLVLELDLNMVKMLHHTKNEVSMSKHTKVIAQTDRQTEGQTGTHRHKGHTDTVKTLTSCMCGQ